MVGGFKGVRVLRLGFQGLGRRAALVTVLGFCVFRFQVRGPSSKFRIQVNGRTVFTLFRVQGFEFRVADFGSGMFGKSVFFKTYKGQLLFGLRPSGKLFFCNFPPSSSFAWGCWAAGHEVPGDVRCELARGSRKTGNVARAQSFV